jgi:thiol:disulfide interchange protein
MNGSRMRFTTTLSAAIVLLATLPSLAQEETIGALPGGDVKGADLFGKGQAADKEVVGVLAQFTHPTAKQPAYLFVSSTIDPGWHIYSISQPTSETGNPTVTKIEVKLPDGVSWLGPFKPLVAPKVHKESGYGDLPIETHEGTVTWYAPIKLAAGLDPTKLKIAGTLSFGACADAGMCRMPEELPFTALLGSGFDVPTDDAGKGATTAKNEEPGATFDLKVFLVQMASAFAGGLILNLMPCVLPVISLKILAFVQQAGESRSRVFLLNVWYSLGLLSVFAVLAALAAGVGMATGERLGWGEQFTDVRFKITMTGLVFVMALSFLGVWEIPIPGFVGTGRAGKLQTQEGPSGAFFKGVFTTILATPCSGPFLGPVFGYVLKQPPYMAYCIFGAIGLGMASPYLLIGAYPALIRFLPKPGEWMDTFKQLMGFLLLATVVYLFNTLTALYVLPTMTLLLGLWFACWWIGRTPLTEPTRRTVAWCGGTAVAVLVSVFAFTFLLQIPKIAWQPYSPAAVAQAQAEGKTVMVDFTANWCPNCKANSKFAIETDAVLDVVKANGVVPLLADWTDKSPAIKQALNELGRNSIPVLAIWPAEGGKPIILSDLVSQSQVLDALKQAGPSRKQ